VPPKPKRSIPLATRRAVAIKHGVDPSQEHATVYCWWCDTPGVSFWPRLRNGAPGSWVAFTLELDHVLPESLGGTEDPDNIVLACPRCNHTKGNRIWEKG
jgi:5-methylcytosine-specific restriction endonuclease McrA